MDEDPSNRRSFLKAMGITVISTMVPVSVNAGMLAPTGSAAMGSMTSPLELWLFDTGKNFMDVGLYDVTRQDVIAALQERRARE